MVKELVRSQIKNLPPFALVTQAKGLRFFIGLRIGSFWLQGAGQGQRLAAERTDDSVTRLTQTLNQIEKLRTLKQQQRQRSSHFRVSQTIHVSQLLVCLTQALVLPQMAENRPETRCWLRSCDRRLASTFRQTNRPPPGSRWLLKGHPGLDSLERNPDSGFL